MYCVLPQVLHYFNPCGLSAFFNIGITSAAHTACVAKPYHPLRDGRRAGEALRVHFIAAKEHVLIRENVAHLREERFQEIVQSRTYHRADAVCL